MLHENDAAEIPFCDMPKGSYILWSVPQAAGLLLELTARDQIPFTNPSQPNQPTLRKVWGQPVV